MNPKPKPDTRPQWVQDYERLDLIQYALRAQVESVKEVIYTVIARRCSEPINPINGNPYSAPKCTLDKGHPSTQPHECNVAVHMKGIS